MFLNKLTIVENTPKNMKKSK